MPCVLRVRLHARVSVPGGRTARVIIPPIVSESATATRTQRVLTGYRPTGPLHVGHWAGNIETCSRCRPIPRTTCFFFIADWHMLTTHYDRTDELPGFVEGLVLDWLAAGLDPERAVIYRQSDLPEVAEMALLLGMITPLGWLERVPSFKERLRDMAERDVANFGLLGYPVLQTVDIAIVRGELVPVGEDQVAHLELSREIVRRFNRLYGDVLVEPQPLLSSTPLIPGSRRPQDVEVARQHDRDPRRRGGDPRDGPVVPHRSAEAPQGRPGPPRDLPGLRAAPEVLARRRRADRGDVPHRASSGAWTARRSWPTTSSSTSRPFRERRAELAATPGLVRDVLAAGARTVRPVARATLAAVRDAMHFGR